MSFLVSNLASFVAGDGEKARKATGRGNKVALVGRIDDRGKKKQSASRPEPGRRPIYINSIHCRF